MAPPVASLPTERPPSPPLSPWPPPGGVKYQVKDGEDWGSVASLHGVQAQALILFNFKTQDPAEVNWYLRVRVGCDVSKNNNWKFSSSAKPGIIYLPPGARAAATVMPPAVKAPDQPPTARDRPFRDVSPPPLQPGSQRANDWKVTVKVKVGGGTTSMINLFIGLDGQWTNDMPDWLGTQGGKVVVSDLGGVSGGGTVLQDGSGRGFMSLDWKFYARELKSLPKGTKGMGKFLRKDDDDATVWWRASDTFNYEVTDVPAP